MFQLSKDQKYAHDYAYEWIKNNTKQNKNDDVLTLGGFAGTGKTRTIAELTKTLKPLRLKIAFATFTGKAATVLLSKLKDAGVIDLCEYVGTIHGLIYKPIINKKGEIEGWSKIPKDEFDYDLIIVDEASMVNKQMFVDLMYYGSPLLAVGDHGQLPPVSNDDFNLMNNPMIKLEKIHRQAENNPIIKVSKMAREGERIPIGNFGKSVFNVYHHSEIVQNILNRKPNRDLILLCGMNNTRVRLNEKIREIQGVSQYDTPQAGERVICLKNNKSLGIMNGQMGTMLSYDNLDPFIMKAEIDFDDLDDPVELLAYRKSFGLSNHSKVFTDLFNMFPMIRKNFPLLDNCNSIGVFEFGNAISVHKSQASSFKIVCLYNERNQYQSDEDYARWLYTGITRAEQYLVIVN